MPLDLNLQPVSDTSLLQSNSFLLTTREVEYILIKEKIVGQNVKASIANHEPMNLQVAGQKINYLFTPVQGKDDLWGFDIVMRRGTFLSLPERFKEVLEGKKPLASAMPENASTATEQSTENKKMATIWITYAWADDKDQDVQFIAQELQRAGLEVKLDKWNIEAGSRLWGQIERFIVGENESDAWVLYATPNSLGSEPCKEEFSYALQRALDNRGRNFPVIGLFPSPVDNQLIPAGIRNRLYVSTTDPDWKERIKAAAEGRSPSIAQPEVQPYQVRHHSVEGTSLLEFRPRAGTWFPFIVGVPLDEKDKIGGNPVVLPGSPNNPPVLRGGFINRVRGVGEAETNDGSRWWTISPEDEGTPAKSLYLVCLELPSKVIFGSQGGPLYMVDHADW